MPPDQTIPSNEEQKKISCGHKVSTACFLFIYRQSKLYFEDTT